MRKTIYCSISVLFAFSAMAQEAETTEYKKRVLETIEVNLLSSYYTQDGQNAAVTSGRGT